jgi:hypothetical protein
MKHFLRLLGICSVLFILLGLFGQNQDPADSGKLSADGMEQVMAPSGILAQHQELPAPVSCSTDAPPPGSSIHDPAKSQQHVSSLHSKLQLVHSKQVFGEIKDDLQQRTGAYLYTSSRKDIRS